MQSTMMIDLDQKSESKRLPTSNSMLFFSGLLFKREFLHPGRKGDEESTEEIQHKVKMNFQKLF